jgi:hypothetical protein
MGSSFKVILKVGKVDCERTTRLHKQHKSEVIFKQLIRDGLTIDSYTPTLRRFCVFLRIQFLV